MRDDSEPRPAILLLLVSLTVLVTCFLMSQAPQPTYSGAESEARPGRMTTSVTP